MSGETPQSDPATFEDIDWDELRTGMFEFDNRTSAFILTVVAYLALLAYDYFLAKDGTLNLMTEMKPVDLVLLKFTGISYDIPAVDWLFIATLLGGAYFVVLPLYDNPRMTRYYWRQFKKNKAAVISLVYLIVIFVVGTLGPIFLAKPELNILATRQPPVYTTVPMEVAGQCIGEVTKEAGSRVCHGTMQYPLGTNAQGMDMGKLLVFGMRVSMQVGLIATALIIFFGTLVGTVAAFSGGLVDELLMRYVDIMQTFPTFFLYLLLIYMFSGSLFLMILIFGIFTWGGVARLVRSEALQRSEEEYITAARNAGASRSWIVRRHLVPNVSNTVITAATLNIPFLILSEAGLSFLGLGDPDAFSWGQTISAGRGELSGAWWIATVPGVFLFFTILAFNFMGDALRDALDPRSEK